MTWVACDFDNDAKTCLACGFVGPCRDARRQCTASQKPGLGDMVASALTAIGITKDRVSALAGGDCGCVKRQQQLNELGRRVGIG